MVNFTYYCYLCGTKNSLELPAPDAPDYHHADLKCSECGNSKHVLLSSCPGEECNRYVYWINDISVPSLVTGFAEYMVQKIQKLIDSAAEQGVKIGISTPKTFPINAKCPCGSELTVEIEICDLCE